MSLKVGLFTSVYFNNIGNGFIDLGAEATLKEAKDDSMEIIKVSQCANFAASMGKSFALKENRLVNFVWTHTMQKHAKKLHDRSYNTVSTLDVFSTTKLFKFDALIIPGCVLTVPFFTIYGKLLRDKAAEGCKLIFLGASGNFYTDYEVNYVRNELKALKPFAIMTRDSVAFEKYKDLSDNVYNGIDNVFFVNRLGLPALDTEAGSYVVVNLEEPKHAEIKKELIRKLTAENKTIIYSNHKPYPYKKVSKLAKEDNMMISDYPLDYLTLYRNVDTVYSDRVHACIPTLSFGNKAVLYSDSPRKSLFENVDITRDSDNVMTINGLRELQDKQIAYLAQVMRKL